MPVKTYRKRPVTVQAIRFNGRHDRDNIFEINTFTGGGFELIDPDNYDPETDGENNTAYVWDYLHETWVGVKDGDYIIQGQLGEFYPHDGDLWPNAYEEVRD